MEANGRVAARNDPGTAGSNPGNPRLNLSRLGGGRIHFFYAVPVIFAFNEPRVGIAQCCFKYFEVAADVTSWSTKFVGYGTHFSNCQDGFLLNLFVV